MSDRYPAEAMERPTPLDRRDWDTEHFVMWLDEFGYDDGDRWIPDPRGAE